MLIDFSIRLTVALLLGGILGIEREYRSKEAGFRTHFLVALGSALFCIVSQYGFGPGPNDASRVAAQVVSGIGFLGAGTIIFQKNVVRGLTTAAGLWVTAAIGLACGAGMLSIAAIATAIILLGLEVINALIPQVGTTTVKIRFTTASKTSILSFLAHIKGDCIGPVSYELKEHRNSGMPKCEVSLEMRVKRGYRSEKLWGLMQDFDDVMISSIK